jgi:hypothetical protein
MSAPPAHDHDWQLFEVRLEDGHTTEEYGCPGCGGVMFR